MRDYKPYNFCSMTKEEFEVLKQEHKESGKSVKTFLAGRGICFTSYYYWKKKFDQPNPEVGLVLIEIHNERTGRSASIGPRAGEIRFRTSGTEEG